MSFPLKLMLGYLVGILLLSLLFSVSIAHLSTINNDYNNLLRDAWRQLNALQTLYASGLQVRFDVDRNPASARADLKLLDSWFVSFLQFNRTGVPVDLAILAQEFHNFRQQTLELVELIESKAPRVQISVKYNAFTKAYNLFLGRIMVEIERSKSKVAVSEVEFLGRVSQLLLLNLILAPLSFLFLYIYGFFLSNSTGLRLNKFLQELARILSGDYKQRIGDDSKDEIGQIATGINELTHRLEHKQPRS
jgi:methyl-accepting chemotaxis protein